MCPKMSLAEAVGKNFNFGRVLCLYPLDHEDLSDAREQMKATHYDLFDS